jgi:hypothetical protein
MAVKTPQRESVEAVKRYRAVQALRERFELALVVPPADLTQWCKDTTDAMIAQYRGE